MWSPSTDSTWTEGLHTMGCSMVPQGDRLQHCIHCPSTMQPSTRYLPPWLGYARAPFVNVCRYNPHQGMPSTPVTTFHLTQGSNLHVTLRYGLGGWIHGRLVNVVYPEWTLAWIVTFKTGNIFWYQGMKKNSQRRLYFHCICFMKEIIRVYVFPLQARCGPEGG